MTVRAIPVTSGDAAASFAGGLTGRRRPGLSYRMSAANPRSRGLETCRAVAAGVGLALLGLPPAVPAAVVKGGAPQDVPAVGDDLDVADDHLGVRVRSRPMRSSSVLPRPSGRSAPSPDASSFTSPAPRSLGSRRCGGRRECHAARRSRHPGRRRPIRRAGAARHRSARAVARPSDT
jgi:hypothetical protein